MARVQVIQTLEKIGELTPKRAFNLFTLAEFKSPAVTTILLANIGALLFYEKRKHFDSIAVNVCQLCKSGEDTPNHLFNFCKAVYSDLLQHSSMLKSTDIGHVIKALKETSFTLNIPQDPSVLAQITALVHAIFCFF